MLDIETQINSIMAADITGSVIQTHGTTINAVGFPAPVGSIALIDRPGSTALRAEVIGFKENLTILYPYGDISGVRRGNRVRIQRTIPWLRVGDNLLGRVIDAEGNAIDGLPQPLLEDRIVCQHDAPDPCSRPRIDSILSTGVRAIDGMFTCGKGQRLGIFAGSGVGKSVTLGMMARYTDADVIVIGLIGERGREVNDFIERDLGKAGLAKSVVVVSTSNDPALLRVRAPMTTLAIAEYFRDQGKDVLVLMDSLTRFAMAQREIGLSAGEPPTTRGYPPSVFAMLPKLVERAGRAERGSITAFFTVLVEGDDMNDPIGDTVRGLLDGHLWLSRKLSTRGHYPAIDPIESISRLMPDICDPVHLKASRAMRKSLAIYLDNEDLISIGAYRAGSNPEIDESIKMRPEIDDYLRQAVEEKAELPETVRRIRTLMLGEQVETPPAAAVETPVRRGNDKSGPDKDGNTTTNATANNRITNDRIARAAAT
ncbi:MAG TPA: EscN/YscN/HrcN family type III secretion system ATPase [Planctomycetaceae bacterium]|nr:EscN/YscN/HrcN family type III secretion system ATPase [Planctomycetaceae bacterium]